MGRVGQVATGTTERLRRQRARRPWLDHAVRAQDRVGEVQGNDLAASVTYFGFLSFFPLMALVFSVTGYVVVIWPEARDQVAEALRTALPGLVGSGPDRINLDAIAEAKEGAGILGLVGLLFAGLGWVDAVRNVLRRVFGVGRDTSSFVKRKLADVVVLVLLGTALLASLAVSSLATAVTRALLGTVGLEESVVATVLLKVLAVAAALLLDVAIFAVLLSRLSGVRLTWRRVRPAAVIGAVGLEVLKLLGTFLVAKTTSNPLYGAFAVVVGLIVWMNLIARLLVFVAGWAATRPYSVEPGDAGPDGGAGRVGGLAARTEPVLAVAPPPSRAPELVPPGGGPAGGDLPAEDPQVVGVAAGDDRKGRALRGMRGFLVGAVAGGAAAVAARRRRSGGQRQRTRG